MNLTKPTRILIDGRELIPDRKTGIGRVLEGLLYALNASDLNVSIILACRYFPTIFKNYEKIKIKKIPENFLSCERTLSQMTKSDTSLFISPYPKLPLFGTHCPSINMIHDVLDLTHHAYKRRIKTFFDAYRLKKALQKADLTWYVSEWSLKETEDYVGFTGHNPRVRYNGIDEIFTPTEEKDEQERLINYSLEPGYILIVGNGMPHKNLGVLLEVANQIKKQLVFVGASIKNQAYWKSRYPGAKATWISHVEDEDFPSLLRGAFCLAQPSTMEGYGYPPLEAMACGVPTVVSDIDVLKETTGNKSLVASPQNPKKWVEVFNVLEDQILYHDQIEKGLKWTKPLIGRNGWHNHLKDIEKLINQQNKYITNINH